MKKTVKLIAAIIGLSSVLSVLPVDAATTGFSITANNSYGSKSSANVKSDSNKLAYVNWTSSNQSSHNEWFKMVNSSNDDRSGEYKFSYCSSGTFAEYSSATYGYYYYLKARRENFWDPSTTVSGKWES